MRINLTIFFLLSSFYFLTAQTEKGTFAVGVELQSMNLSVENQSLIAWRNFSIDGNLTADYFIKDNWSVGIGIGTDHVSSRYSGKLYNYNIFINSTKYFRNGAKWQPFIEGSFGYQFNYFGLQEINGVLEDYIERKLTLDIGGGIQYNASKNFSVFLRITPEMTLDLDTSFDRYFIFHRAGAHIGMNYNFSQKE